MAKKPFRQISASIYDPVTKYPKDSDTVEIKDLNLEESLTNFLTLADEVISTHSITKRWADKPEGDKTLGQYYNCLLYTSPSPRDRG